MRDRLRIRVGIAGAVGRVMWPLVRRMSLRREHRGFRLLSFLSPDEGMDEVAHARVALALDLIAASDPRRFERIRRDMPNIRVIRAGGGFLEAAVPTCVVDWPDVMWNPVAHLAATIVHEATHARLHRAGIGYPAAWQRRIERRCVLEEIAFLRRLPDGGATAARREAEMEPALAGEWWLPHHAIERAISQARAERVPRWLLRWLEYRQARLARKAAAQRGVATRRHDPERDA